MSLPRPRTAVARTTPGRVHACGGRPVRIERHRVEVTLVGGAPSLERARTRGTAVTPCFPPSPAPPPPPPRTHLENHAARAAHVQAPLEHVRRRARRRGRHPDAHEHRTSRGVPHLGGLAAVSGAGGEARGSPRAHLARAVKAAAVHPRDAAACNTPQRNISSCRKAHSVRRDAPTPMCTVDTGSECADMERSGRGPSPNPASTRLTARAESETQLLALTHTDTRTHTRRPRQTERPSHQ